MWRECVGLKDEIPHKIDNFIVVEILLSLRSFIFA